MKADLDAARERVISAAKVYAAWRRGPEPDESFQDAINELCQAVYALKQIEAESVLTLRSMPAHS